EKISDKNYRDWRWRECFLYLEGQLYILESKDIRKGERFIHFNLRDGYLRTNFGTYIINDNQKQHLQIQDIPLIIKILT
ncbi:hypothetical protein, partial [Eubacterium sp.]|uniref:hypothetical protein n=1 Tax=Eubacterium sp. TaxID=142586 RepID=UPI003F0EBC8E